MAFVTERGMEEGVRGGRRDGEGDAEVSALSHIEDNASRRTWCEWTAVLRYEGRVNEVSVGGERMEGKQ